MVTNRVNTKKMIEENGKETFAHAGHHNGSYSDAYLFCGSPG